MHACWWCWTLDLCCSLRFSRFYHCTIYKLEVLPKFIRSTLYSVACNKLWGSPQSQSVGVFKWKRQTCWKYSVCPLNSPLQVVKLHTKLGKPIPSTEPSMVTQTLSSTTAAPSKTTTANLNSSSATNSLCMAASSSSPANSSSPPYLKPVNIVSSGVTGGKNPLASSLSAANSVSTGKKVNAPKINFVG